MNVPHYGEGGRQLKEGWLSKEDFPGFDTQLPNLVLR